MRTKKQSPRGRRIQTGVKTAQVARGIDRDVHTERLHPIAKHAMAIAHWFGEEGPRDLARNFAETGELEAAGDDASRWWPHVCVGWRENPSSTRSRAVCNF